MNWWSKLMQIFVRPPREDLPLGLRLRRDDKLDDDLSCAVEKHKEASRTVVTASLDQIQRSADVNIALKSIMDKLEESAVLRTAQGAADLVAGRNVKDGEPS
jgi:hypothetical protein